MSHSSRVRHTPQSSPARSSSHSSPVRYTPLARQAPSAPAARNPASPRVHLAPSPQIAPARTPPRRVSSHYRTEPYPPPAPYRVEPLPVPSYRKGTNSPPHRVWTPPPLTPSPPPVVRRADPALNTTDKELVMVNVIPCTKAPAQVIHRIVFENEDPKRKGINMRKAMMWRELKGAWEPGLVDVTAREITIKIRWPATPTRQFQYQTRNWRFGEDAEPFSFSKLPAEIAWHFREMCAPPDEDPVALNCGGIPDHPTRPQLGPFIPFNRVIILGMWSLDKKTYYVELGVSIYHKNPDYRRR